MSTGHRGGVGFAAIVVLAVSFSTAPARAQASYTAQVRHAAVPHALVILWRQRVWPGDRTIEPPSPHSDGRAL